MILDVDVSKMNKKQLLEYKKYLDNNYYLTNCGGVFLHAILKKKEVENRLKYKFNMR